MPKIIIGNVDNDSMIGDLSKMDERLRGITSTIANRLLWLAEPSDIAVLPFPVADDILAHIASVSGASLDPGRIIAVDGEGSGPRIITSDVLLNKDTLRRVKAAMGEEKDWQVVAYFHTSAVSAFADALGIVEPSSMAFLAEGGAELFNSKSFFRKAMLGADLPIAEGAVCVSLSQAQLAAAKLIGETGSIILKEQFNGGGDGNAVITFGDRQTQMGAIPKWLSKPITMRPK